MKEKINFEQGIALFLKEKAKATSRRNEKIASSNLCLHAIKRNNKTIVSCDKNGFKITIESPLHTSEMVEEMIIDLINQNVR